MSNTCTGDHYTCGETSNWLTGSDNSHSLIQVRDSKSSFMLGETEIIVVSQKRNFSIQGASSWELDSGSFLMYDNDNLLFQCATINNTSNGTLSEDYTVITTVAHFIDTRYGNGIFTEVKDELKFSVAGTMCGFKETWGVQWYHKFVITSTTVNRTTTYFVVLNGVKTILRTVAEAVEAYSNPLIIVYPNPPALSIPWENCDDINQYGFYDYHPDGTNQDKIREDGGDDFYWTDWMRVMGIANAAADAAAAEDRYLTYYLASPHAGTSGISNPGILTDSTPVGSICRDKDGNVFYSVTLGGESFSGLTDGDLSDLFPLVGNGEYHPVGLA